MLIGVYILAPIGHFHNALDKRPHSGRYCYGKTPWQTFLDSKHVALAKYMADGGDTSDNLIDRQVVVG